LGPVASGQVVVQGGDRRAGKQDRPHRLGGDGKKQGVRAREPGSCHVSGIDDQIKNVRPSGISVGTVG
jgi:hypothetical protein